MIECLYKKNVPARTSSPRGISSSVVKLARPTLEGGGWTAIFS
jgi:hypothetical protein